ncbi:MAG TPA: SDR family oxidoreductase, partial [Dehalococcoidia bacterium]|nr:SDR family oxidoreductase [Dehalococcoidia bacterium]
MTNHKWVLITGANGGIGKSLVKCFLENDYKVIAVDKISANPFDDLNVEHLHLDLEQFVADDSYARNFIDRTTEITSGRGIFALINNAAVQIFGHCNEVSRLMWSQSFSVNLSAPFFLIQGFLDQLSRNRGCVVNISSI